MMMSYLCFYLFIIINIIKLTHESSIFLISYDKTVRALNLMDLGYGLFEFSGIKNCL